MTPAGARSSNAIKAPKMHAYFAPTYDSGIEEISMADERRIFLSSDYTRSRMFRGIGDMMTEFLYNASDEN